MVGSEIGFRFLVTTGQAGPRILLNAGNFSAGFSVQARTLSPSSVHPHQEMEPMPNMSAATHGSVRFVAIETTGLDLAA